MMNYLCLLFFLWMFLTGDPLAGQSYKRDNAFGGKGTVRFSNGRYNEVKTIVATEDKKHFYVLIESGTLDTLRDTDILVLKFSAEGRTESSFGKGGQITFDFYGMDISRPGDLKLLPDGSLLIAGDGSNHSYPGINLSCLVKILSDGSTDRSFGKEGTLPVRFDHTSYVSALCLNDKDESVFIGGNYLMPFGNHIDVFPTIGKINLNGTPDTSFGKTGKEWIDFYQGVFSLVSKKHTAGGEIRDIIVLPDGKILICGGFLFSYTYEGFIARLHPDGRLDGSFHGKGFIRYDFTPGKFNAIKKMILYDNNTVIFGANSQTDFDSDFYFGTLTLNDCKMTITKIDFNGQHDILEDISLKDGEVILSGRSILPQHVARHFRSDYAVMARIPDVKNPKVYEPFIFSLDQENQNGIMAHAVLDKRIMVAGFVHTSDLFVKDVVVSCFKRK